MVLAAQINKGCTNPNCKAKKQSTHTTANCYWPGGRKEGQFPIGFGQHTKINATTPTPTTTMLTIGAVLITKQAKNFVFSVWVLDTPG